MMKLRDGAYVRITLKNSDQDFGIFSAQENFECYSDSQVVSSELYMTQFDPLTSYYLEGLYVARSCDVKSVEVVNELPVKSDFVIDSISRLSAEHDTHLFFKNILAFLNESDLAAELLPENLTSLRRSHLNELGVDFLRQHYRKLRIDFIQLARLPTQDELSDQLMSTLENRTKNEDWSELRHDDTSTIEKWAIDEVLDGFYRISDPFIAVRAMRAAFFYNRYFEGHPEHLAMFTRIAETSAKTKALFSRLTGAIRSEKAFQTIMDPPENLKGDNYAPQVISNCEELDVCWTEFLVTGSVNILSRIAAVLDWSDLARSLLNKSVSEPAPIQLSDTAWRAMPELGIPIVVTKELPFPQITGHGDVDILLSRAVQAGRDAAKSIFQQLTQEQVLYMTTKSAALWSLMSYAKQHPIVREFCEQAAAEPGGDARVYLASSTA